MSIIKLLKNAESVWLPNWYQWFSDDDSGGFFERLDCSKQAIELPKRLLTQCRQLIVYCNNPQETYNIDDGFQYILDHYWVKKTGGSIFSRNSDGSICDDRYDLYAHAFVLLCCSSYYNATKNPKALEYAEITADFIERHFKATNGLGYVEALDKELAIILGIRRQNPHMHLLEAYIALFKTTQNTVYLDKADKLVMLFFSHFYDANLGVLREFFDDSLSPHERKGDLIEAGHHSEWVWLLKEYKEVSGSEDTKLEPTMKSLFSWVLDNGIDKENGGVFNVQTPDGKIIDSNKRIWATMETLRAASIMLEYEEFTDSAQKVIDSLCAVVEKNYIDIDSGSWVEVLSKNLEAEVDYYPGTSPYHIYPVLKGANQYCEKLKG